MNLHYVDLPVDKAVERGKARFAETGRNVPLDYIRSVGLKPKHNFDKLKTAKEVDSYGEWSNDVDRGQRPRLLEERPTGLYSKSELAGRGQRVLLKDGKVEEDSEQNQKAQGRRKDSADKVTHQEDRSENQDGFSMRENDEAALTAKENVPETRAQEPASENDIQNANAASTSDRSVETHANVLSYKKKAQEIVSGFEKGKISLTKARQDIVPIELNARSGRIEMNVLTSIYGRGNRRHTDNDYKWFVDNVISGNTLYVNKKTGR